MSINRSVASLGGAALLAAATVAGPAATPAAGLAAAMPTVPNATSSSQPVGSSISEGDNNTLTASETGRTGYTARLTDEAAPVPESVTPSPLVVKGLLNRQKAPADTTVKGFVIDPTWASVQPTANGPLVTTQIDNELAQARAKGLRVKLRVEAGRNAPTWVKELAGGPVTMQDISASGGIGPFTVPRFWTPEVMAAYDQLQLKLAAKYDGNATIGQVTLNGPMTQFPEPYLRNASDPANAQALLGAGFTVALDKVAHDRNMLAGTAWTVTPLEVTFNPYQSVTTAKVFPDVAYTITEMQEFRTMYGGRAVLANYSISTSRSGDYTTMYAEQKRLGTPISYQTAIAAKIGNWQQTLDWAVAQGASSVELPREYTTWDQTLLKTYNAKLAAN